MDAAEHFKFPVIRRLKPDTQPVYTAFSPRCSFLLCHGSRIYFHRDLGVIRNVEVLLKSTENPGTVIAFQNRRRTAAQKYRTYPVSIKIIFPRSDLFGQSVYIKRPLLRICRGGQEITVCTFSHAERNMHIQFQFFFLTHQSSSSFSTLINAFCGISTLPTWRMRFFPSFCFSRSFFLREISPP